MPADKEEELHVQYWRLSKLDNLEILYHEVEYSLSLLLGLHNILKDKRITKNNDISDLIDLARLVQHTCPLLALLEFNLQQTTSVKTIVKNSTNLFILYITY
jgi:hypothetical protein